MAGKGPIDTVIDLPAINELIVFMSKYRMEVIEKTQRIITICKTMSEDESLNGGDGEEIKNNFITIATGCNKLSQSVEYIVNKLNDKLSVGIDMTKGKTTKDSTEKSKTAAAKLGVMKE